MTSLQIEVGHSRTSLLRIVGTVSGRGYEIDHLAYELGPADMARIMLSVTDSRGRNGDHLSATLSNLVEVRSVTRVEDGSEARANETAGSP